jgi:hypothetical protein
MTSKYEALFLPPPVPDDLRRAAQEQGWPEGLLERVVALHLPRRHIAWWIENGETGVQDAQRIVTDKEGLARRNLSVREAVHSDNDGLADLWANAPEDLGDWEVTVERSPNAFAQFALFENVAVQILEDHGVPVACLIWSPRNVVVGDQRLSIHCAMGLRVRKECRGLGYGNLIRGGGWPAHLPPSQGQFFYVRSKNRTAIGFFEHTNPNVMRSMSEGQGDLPGIPVTVLQYPGRPYQDNGGARRIRRAQHSDLRRCVALINRTHRGSDLFWPYTVQSFELKLQQGFWGARGAEFPHVYGWEEYFVCEEGGQIVACGGLWDRGRDVRERWRHTATGRERVIASTALMDFGFARGSEGAMAGLIA